MNNKNNQCGFTLIELMIVVAIIGILASIALPAYQDYIVRAQVSDSIILLESAQTDIHIDVSENGQFPADTAALVALGTGVTGSYGELSTSNVSGANGDLIYTFTSGNTNIQNKTVTYNLIFTSGNGTWTCSSTLSAQYKPKHC
jgi:type IV pilus assembly protein PilA